MYVFLFGAAGADDMLFEIVLVIGGEPIEHDAHFGFGALGDSPRNREKRFVRFELGAQREIPPDRFPLMILADLHRNILENARYSFASVEDDRRKLVAFLFEIVSGDLIFELGLVPQFVHVKVLMFVGIAHDEHAVFAPEERDIHDDDDRPRQVHFLGYDDGIEMLRDRTRRNADVFAELFLRAFAAHELFPEFPRLSRWAPRTAHRFAADRAQVPGNAVPFPVFNDRPRAAKAALFCSCFTNVFK